MLFGNLCFVTLCRHFQFLKLVYLQVKRLLGDYDAIHVRRGDKIKTRKDRFGVLRTLHPHLDRDTRPEFILMRIKKWIPPGRTLFIASNERKPGFFSPLSVRYVLQKCYSYIPTFTKTVSMHQKLSICMLVQVTLGATVWASVLTRTNK